MKFRFLAFLVTLTGSMPAMAQSSQYPFIAPKCHNTLRIPENQAGVYFSEDCRTAFIMPDKYGKFTVDSVSDLPNLDLCPGVSKAEATVLQLQAQVEAMGQKVGEMPIGSPLREKAMKDLDSLIQLQRKLLSTYDGILGGYAQVTFANNSFEQRKNEFLIMNQDMVINNRVNLLQMPVSESYLTFLEVPLAGDARMKAVLGHAIPGVGAPNEDGIAMVKSIFMNGSVSGQLAISLYGLCGKRRPNWQPSELSSLLVTNMTYTVPVMSLASYEASLKTDIAVRTFIESIQRKSKFTVDEMTRMLASGASGSAFHFKLLNHEMPKVYSEEAQKNFYSGLREEVYARLTIRFLEQLRVSGFLQLEQPPKINEAPPPGYVDEVHTGRSCNSSWFGLVRGCSSYTYTVKIPVDSRAETIINKFADLKFTDEERTEIRQVIPRIYTAAFVPNPPAAKKE